MVNVVLGIETSCDETSAAVLERERGVPKIRSLVILSQDVHAVFGGVVPELASRAHLTALTPVVDRALADAGVTIEDLDAIAVTAGPGLIGALLVGVCYAKSLSWAAGTPLIGVHHLEGHVFAPTLEEPDLEPPFVALIVSGGHTLLLDVPAWGAYNLLGVTRDDAAGEAFDKVASLLDLGYPGGPEIERVAASGTDRFRLPRPMIDEGLDFSFSGLKTAVLHTVRGSTDIAQDRADIAASFQAAAIDVLVTKLHRAIELKGYSTALLGGGVACNRALVAEARARLVGTHVAVASPRINTDNAAMIARAGWFHLERGTTSPQTLEADSRMPWPGLDRRAEHLGTPAQ